MCLTAVTAGPGAQGVASPLEGVEWGGLACTRRRIARRRRTGPIHRWRADHAERLAGAETVVDGGWLVPGLVDVHTHPGPRSRATRWTRSSCASTAGRHRRRGNAAAGAGVGRSSAGLVRPPRRTPAGLWGWAVAGRAGRLLPGWDRQVEVAALPELAVGGRAQHPRRQRRSGIGGRRRASKPLPAQAASSRRRPSSGMIGIGRSG
jgi:hypothetical protein